MTLRSKGSSANRLASYLRAPHWPIAEKLTPGDPTARETQNGAYVAASGSDLQLEWQSFTGDAWRRGDWVLLPYVHPVDDPARKRFLRDIKKVLDFRGNDEAKLAKSLLERIRSMESAKRLVEIYTRHFAGAHNAISMSLYSGPLSQGAGASSSHTEPSRQWRSSLEGPPYGRFFWSHDGIGWLGTGDAALRHDKWRQPWRTFFEGFDDRIVVMTLPHHGSANNFHPEILGFRALRFALATTGEARNRVSRLRETLGAVEQAGIHTRVIDDGRLSRFTVTCERSMA
ncbi:MULTISPECIES: hypothetical protein [Rhizobium]|uniref:DUF4238 domain-containing protein n=1 Tax=Rhizobium brockwellii TaxID=3019932 RepID=A0ABU3YY09_9HYPH|nr:MULTISPECIES: hypothetical protein [Rhizobium]MDV4159020.1 hypothetical protein [Rhizobium brockwellii]MDV4183742.1 hypothetical protein [Rhizobium brockwellii]MDV4190713.1 hypothetical protein [Rhizobium brockwellii]NZD54943.1 hypothetical protein [Rhizobium leguminosarum]QIO63221.1 hypothetical protein HA463_36780 [Rhizobium leguminosarum bv. trifolii]